MATLKVLMTTLSKQGLQEQRGEIIYNFTKGRTSSARELKPKEINDLCRALNGQNPQGYAELDKKKKRLLAVIFGMFEKMGKEVSMDYVKGIACRAARVKDFNQIPSERLVSLYNAFLNAQKDLSFAQRLMANLELEISQMN